MGVTVRMTDNPNDVLDAAGRTLAADPVRNNLILTLLHTRVIAPEPGYYWMAEQGGRVIGVALQSPRSFMATVSPLSIDAGRAMVDAIVDGGVSLPGVNGEAATVAGFAGHWTERTKSPAYPVQGQRIYELDEVLPVRATAGGIRPARDDDRESLIGWWEAFERETGATGGDPVVTVERRLAAGHLWVWETGSTVAMAGVSAPVAGVSRIGPVYTPPDRRGRGYATALVAEISNAARRRRERSILYTDLGNPVSNSIYRKIGYEAVAEALRYRFGSG